MTDEFRIDDSLILQRVLELSYQMAEERDLDALLDYVMDQSIHFTKGQHGYLVLIDKVTGELDFQKTYGSPDQDQDKQGRPVSRTSIEQVVKSQKYVLHKNALHDTSLSEASSVFDLQLKSVLCAPLIARGDLLGVLYLENRHAINAFNEADIAPVMIFASQAAVAIQNAQLHYELQVWANELEQRVVNRTIELEKARYAAEENWSATLEENLQRTALLANIAHDLRSPLNTAISSLGMIQEGYFGEINAEQNDWIERSLTAVNQVLRLASDVFELTKIEQGRLSFEPRAVELLPLLQEGISIAEGLRRVDSPVELILDAPHDLPLVMADPDRVRQILTNLLANALKFTQEGSVMLRAGLAENPAWLIVEVLDTGVGIPEDDLPEIFERFKQAANQNAGYRGTGLGLAICRQLVEQHGGIIWVESVTNGGSTFYFSLPVAN